MTKVLVTGGNGFIASHIISVLMKDKYHVVATVRSKESAESISHLYKDEKFECVVVADITTDCAFDETFIAYPDIEYVIHTASPFTQQWKSPDKDILEPAIKGTVSCLQSTRTHGSNVKRVIITSSFVTFMDTTSQNKVYDETMWNPVTFDAAVAQPRLTYIGSKTLAEKAAWDFMKDRQSFDLVSMNPPLVFGPLLHPLTNPEKTNLSNQRVLDMINGKFKDSALPPTGFFVFADVRDVAQAHVTALTVPDASGQRFSLISGHYSNNDIADVIAENFSELVTMLPSNMECDRPKDVYGFTNAKARDVLGIKFKPLAESITDTVLSLQVK